MEPHDSAKPKLSELEKLSLLVASYRKANPNLKNQKAKNEHRRSRYRKR